MPAVCTAAQGASSIAPRRRGLASEQAAPPRRPRRGDLHRRGQRLLRPFVDQRDVHQNTPGTRCQPTRWQYCWYAASALRTRSSISARTISAVSASRISRRSTARMRRQERDVGDQIAGVNRMPHQSVRTAHDHAAVGRDDAEAAAERHLADHDEQQADAETSAVTDRAPAPVRRWRAAAPARPGTPSSSIAAADRSIDRGAAARNASAPRPAIR